MSGPLDGKIAAITGAGNGIGRAAAQKLASAGARVVVNDLDPVAAAETVDIVEKAGATAIAHVGNVTETGFAESFIDTAVGELGGLDIIVNNAGYTWDGVIQHMADEQWDAMFDVHVKAPFRIFAPPNHTSAGGPRPNRQPADESHARSST